MLAVVVDRRAPLAVVIVDHQRIVRIDPFATRFRRGHHRFPARRKPASVSWSFLRAEPTIIPTWPEGNRDVRCPPARSAAGAIRSSPASEVERRHAEPVRDWPCPPTFHSARARQVAAEQILDQLARRGIGQGLALVRPILELDEAPRLGACRVEPAELGELAHGALGVERPEGGLQHFHRQRAERRGRGLRMAPHVLQRGARRFRITREIPRRGEGRRRARTATRLAAAIAIVPPRQ